MRRGPARSYNICIKKKTGWQREVLGDLATPKYCDQYVENTVTFLKAYGLKIFAGAILIWFGMVLEAYIAITSDPYLGFGILLFTVVVWMAGPARHWLRKYLEGS